MEADFNLWEFNDEVVEEAKYSPNLTRLMLTYRDTAESLEQEVQKLKERIDKLRNLADR